MEYSPCYEQNLLQKRPLLISASSNTLPHVLMVFESKSILVFLCTIHNIPNFFNILNFDCGWYPLDISIWVLQRVELPQYQKTIHSEKLIANTQSISHKFYLSIGLSDY